MVRQAQKVDQLRQPKGVLGEGSLRQQKEEDGRGWFSKIPAIFKILGRSRLADQVRQEVVRDGGAIPTQESNTSVKPTRVRSNNTSKASGQGTRKTVCSPAKSSKAKSKAVSKD